MSAAAVVAPALPRVCACAGAALAVFTRVGPAAANGGARKTLNHERSHVACYLDDGVRVAQVDLPDLRAHDPGLSRDRANQVPTTNAVALSHAEVYAGEAPG
jgi:hypothetical protein